MTALEKFNAKIESGTDEEILGALGRCQADIDDLPETEGETYRTLCAIRAALVHEARRRKVPTEALETQGEFFTRPVARDEAGFVKAGARLVAPGSMFVEHDLTEGDDLVVVRIVAAGTDVSTWPSGWEVER